MAILSAVVEPTGWILALTLAASRGSFLDYALTPDATPSVMLSSYHAGHRVQRGQAFRATSQRFTAATTPIRMPVDPHDPLVNKIDETLNANGTITVRLALANTIYATDAGCSLRVAAGWRTGEGAATLAVTNRSTIVAPIPIFRWADVPYQIYNSTITLEIAVASHHPVGGQSVAGVRFTVTDGINVDSFWTTQLETSSQYGDNMRCHRVVIDASRAAAFRAGPLRCDAEIYPWLGNVRSTGAIAPKPIGGSGSGGFDVPHQTMDNLATASFNTPATTPFIVAWDPGQQRYKPALVYVDVNGTSDATKVSISDNEVTAQSVPAKDVAVAFQAIALAGRSAPAVNGSQVGGTNMADGVRIRCRAGVHPNFGSLNVSTALTANESWVIVEGDPADTNSRSNVVIQTGDLAPGLRASRVMFRNLTIELGTQFIDYGTVPFWWFNNVEMRGKTGQEQNSKQPTITNNAVIFYTQTRYWKHGFSIRWAGSHQPYLVRACEVSRRVEATSVFTTTWIAAQDATVADIPVGSAELYAVGSWPNIPDLGAQQDVMMLFNDLRSTRDRTWHPSRLSAALAGGTMDVIRRNVFINNLVERVLPSDGDTNFSIGEDDTVEMSYNIIEGNTHIGERTNELYGTPYMRTLADCDTLNSIAYCNRVANNAGDKCATKHDNFDDPATRYIRTNAGVVNPTGYRPQCTGAWSAYYGVDFENNHDFGRVLGDSFLFAYFGRGSKQQNNGIAYYVDDRSRLGSGGGQGDYHPTLASPLRNRAVRANFDRDLKGSVRGSIFAIGCLEPT